MMSLSINLLVLRANEPGALAPFYEGVGLKFESEKHGSGPKHLACNIGGSVFEIYPRTPEGPPTTGVRIGFAVPSISAALDRLGDHADVISKPKNTDWGRRVVLHDPEGHKVELTEQAS